MIRHRHAVPTPPARVVVLGASGFVGGDLVCHLRESGIPVLGLSSRDVDLLRPESVVLLESLSRPGDAVVFVSALTPDRGKDVRTLMRNLVMGEHVAAFVERSACTHLVYVSSDAVYDDGTNPVREDSPCNPASFHGVMHLARERMLTHAARKANVPYLVLRPTLLYGANDTHNGYGPNRFLGTAPRQRTIQLFGQGEEKRDHVYIRDLSRLLVLGLSHRSEGLLNVATGRSVAFREVASLVAELCPAGVRIECLPRATPVTHRHFDVTATFQAFPSFRFTPLATGLAITREGTAARTAA
jgi:nucleoside-diphosphate-sugar epimerase